MSPPRTSNGATPPSRGEFDLLIKMLDDLKRDIGAVDAAVDALSAKVTTIAAERGTEARFMGGIWGAGAALVVAAAASIVNWLLP